MNTNFNETEVTGAFVGKKIVKAISSIVSFMVLLIFLLLFAFGCYALWDSDQIYQEAKADQYEIYKPVIDDSLSFAELIEKNGEVFGWITVYGTNIDYPLLQTDNNSKYINTNVLGEYSLSGSIFLDYRNNKSFTDFNSIIYGHHMVQDAMFGQINDFLEEDYFETHQYGNLFYDDTEHGLEFFAIMEADAYDTFLFTPAYKDMENKQSYIDYLYEKALLSKDIGITTEDKIVLLYTCSSGLTNGRHILVGRVTDETFVNPFVTEEEINTGKPIDSESSYPLWFWLLMIIFLIIFAIFIIIQVRKRVGDKGYKKGEDLHEHTENQ